MLILLNNTYALWERVLVKWENENILDGTHTNWEIDV
jgi:hypothetical protein